MEIGSTYRNIEEYLEALEKRQMQEKAPTAAIFFLGAEDMMFQKFGGIPWLTRVRCELPTRPLGPSGEEEPVRATFVGACSGEDPERYERFVEAMALIDVYKCAHLRSRPVHPKAKNKGHIGPSARALAHLEQSDIIVMGDGDINHEAWYALAEGVDGLMERIKWRYYCGAVLIGLGTGCQLLSKKWYTGEPKHELTWKRCMESGRRDYPQKGIDYPESEAYMGFKATEIVPLIMCRTNEHAIQQAELQGAIACAISLPPLGGLVFNVDGTLEPCCSLLHEYRWNWKQREVRMCLLSPPDEKTNVLKCQEYVEKRRAKARAKRVALGLPAEAPLPIDEEDEDSDEDSDPEDPDEVEQRKDLERAIARAKRASFHSPFHIVNERKHEEAEYDRQRGAELFKDGDYDRSLQAFEDALEKDSYNFKLHLNRAATLLKIEQPRRAVLAADRALHLCEGKEAKAWYRRAAAWLAAGEFNEAIADCDQAKKIEPSNKDVGVLRKKAETEREDATWTFAYDQKIVDRQKRDAAEAAREAEEAVTITDLTEGETKALKKKKKKKKQDDAWISDEKGENVAACRTMVVMEEFTGQQVELHDGHMTLKWDPTRENPDGREEELAPAMLDQRALFCIEELTKRGRFLSLSIRGACLGAWGAAFIARGARIEGAGLEEIKLVECRLRGAGAASIASLLSRGSKLVEVDLTGNAIGDEGMKALCDGLKKNEYLEILKVPYNRIGNRRMGDLALVLRDHPTLRHLDLSHNSIGFSGACQIATGVRDAESMQHLIVGYNQFRSDGIFRLANVAQGHPTLSSIDVRGIYLRKGDRRRLEAHTRFTRLEIFIDPPPVVIADSTDDPLLEQTGAGPNSASAGAKAAGAGAENADESDDDGPILEDGEEAVPIKHKPTERVVPIDPSEKDEDSDDDDGPMLEELTEQEAEQFRVAEIEDQKADERSRKRVEIEALEKESADREEFYKEQNQKNDGFTRGPAEKMVEDVLPEGLVVRPDVVKGATRQEVEEEQQRKAKETHDEVLRVTGLNPDEQGAWRPELDKDDDVKFDVTDELWIYSFSKLGLY